MYIRRSVYVVYCTSSNINKLTHGFLFESEEVFNSEKGDFVRKNHKIDHSYHSDSVQFHTSDYEEVIKNGYVSFIEEDDY